MRVEGGLAKENQDISLEANYYQVRIHTQTGVGAHELETHFKNIDYAKKGDGGSVFNSKMRK